MTKKKPQIANYGMTFSMCWFLEVKSLQIEKFKQFSTNFVCFFFHEKNWYNSQHKSGKIDKFSKITILTLATYFFVFVKNK